MSGLVMAWKIEVGLAFAHVKGVGLFTAIRDESTPAMLWKLYLNGERQGRRAQYVNLSDAKMAAQRKLAEMMGLAEASMEEDNGDK